MEGDPRPGALKGRMSFQSFNPSVDVSYIVFKLDYFTSLFNEFSPCRNSMKRLQTINEMLPLLQIATEIQLGTTLGPYISGFLALSSSCGSIIYVLFYSIFFGVQNY